MSQTPCANDNTAEINIEITDNNDNKREVNPHRASIELPSEAPKKIGRRWHVNARGQVLFKGNESYSLMLSTQLLIRTLVAHISERPSRAIEPADFEISLTIPFPKKGSLRTPSHDQPDFVSKDYRPMVFRKLRERFGIDPRQYMLSICGDDSLSMQSTPGKSGSLFFFSSDMQYVLKTVTRAEAKFLMEILPHYYNHVMLNPNTLLPRFFGCHLIKPRGGSNVRFVVMNNVVDTNLKIHQLFDLKGSTVGRSLKDDKKDKKHATESSSKKVPVKKDNDIEKGSVIIGSEMKSVLLQQLRADADFLASMNIMDYSLLLGMHEVKKSSPEDNEVIAAGEHKSEFPAAKESHTTTASSPNTISAPSVSSSSLSTLAITPSDTISSLGPKSNPPTDKTLSPRSQDESGPASAHQQTSRSGYLGVEEEFSAATTLSDDTSFEYEDEEEDEDEAEGGNKGRDKRRIPRIPKAAIFAPKKKENPAIVDAQRGIAHNEFQRQFGGMKGSDSEGNEVYYFVGIIDILQQWNSRKKVENFAKGLIHNKDQISAVSPRKYSKRFCQFLDNIFV